LNTDRFLEKTDNGSSRGYGHIQFASPSDALTALRSLNRDPMFIEDRRIRARFPAPPSERVKGPKTKANQLFVGNLPFVLEEQELREHFQAFGEISAIRMGMMP
jgi:RNA recognition motif-containing protein